MLVMPAATVGAFAARAEGQGSRSWRCKYSGKQLGARETLTVIRDERLVLLELICPLKKRQQGLGWVFRPHAVR